MGGVVCKGEEHPTGCGKTTSILKYVPDGQWQKENNGMRVARSSFALVPVPQDYFDLC